MKLLGTCRLVDILSEWGSHNTQWRLGRDVVDVLDGVEFALTYYSELVSTVLAAGPIGCFRVEVATEDLPQIVLHNGQLMTDWVNAVEVCDNENGNYVRRMAAENERIVYPLICSCKGDLVNAGLGLQLYPPFVIFDGWHRGAAWVVHVRAGREYPVAGRLVVTTRPTPWTRVGWKGK